jgi:hypothetical protein
MREVKMKVPGGGSVVQPHQQYPPQIQQQQYLPPHQQPQHQQQQQSTILVAAKGTVIGLGALGFAAGVTYVARLNDVPELESMFIGAGSILVVLALLKALEYAAGEQR